MSAPTRLVLREAAPQDAERILSAFNAAFAAVDPSFQPRTLASWRWRFVAAPDGARALLALDEEGELVAQYAGLGQRFMVDGEPLRACQAVDSFVLPGRRALGRSGAFVAAGLAFAERFGGRGPGRDAFMWGLPVRPAWRIGRARLGYELVRELVQLVADPAAVVARAADGAEIEEVELFPPEVDPLFERLAPGLGVVALRDRARLDWRYVRHPERPYRLALAREAGALAGWAVYRAGTFDGQQAGLAVDWLVDPAAGAARDALLAWLAARARGDRRDRLVALLPPRLRAADAGDWLALQRAGFRVHPTRYLLVARTWTRAPSIDLLRERMHVTLGDTDLA